MDQHGAPVGVGYSVYCGVATIQKAGGGLELAGDVGGSGDNGNCDKIDFFYGT